MTRSVRRQLNLLRAYAIVSGGALVVVATAAHVASISQAWTADGASTSPRAPVPLRRS